MYKKFFKRIFDFLFSLFLLPLLLIIILFVGPIIYFQDRGTIFYNAPRLGMNGVIFKMYKFRTMKMNAPDFRNPDGSTFNAKDDPRLTKIGKFLRKTSIDEIPQILNVLFGNMSFVGPRPDLAEHMQQYTEIEKKKLNVLPGITGYNQAYFRNSIPWKQRLENDVYYSENVSLKLDIKIIFNTIVSVLKNKNIYNSK